MESPWSRPPSRHAGDSERRGTTLGGAWMPGAGCVQASADGGELRGGAPRAVWQTLETDPRLVSARSAAQCLDELGRAPHLVWNPLTGETVQLISILRAGRALGGPDGLITAGVCLHDEAARVNREGRLCVQIAVIGFAKEPFTSGPMAGLDLILSWLESWRVPQVWPAGPPAPFMSAHGAPRCRRLWARGGHFGGSQVPDCSATGPGAVEIKLLTGPATDLAIEIPRRALEGMGARDATAPRRDKAMARGAQIHLGRRHEQENADAQLTSTA
jgi:hypothetical protein